MMTPYKAVLFDVDWTLLNTEQFIFQAYLHTLKKFDLPSITLPELLPQMGKQIEKCYEVFAPGFDKELLISTHQAFQADHLDLAIPYPNTQKVLKELKENGIKIAAVTSRSEKNVHKTLEVTDLLSFLDTIVTRDDVKPEHFKPHPRPFLLALERLQTDPHSAFTVGDAYEDIEAGEKAGTQTIGVTYGSVGNKIKNSNPDFIIDDIIEVIKIVMPHTK